jgi:ribonuclease HI
MPRPSGTLPFGEPESSAAKNSGSHVAYVDGASRGNPGPASYAVILRAPDGKTVLEIGKYLGRATNNVAEYYGLITALDYAQAQGVSRLLVRSDSQLLVRQMQGRYKVKSPDLRPLYERARKMAGALAHFAIEHIPRELNSAADELANIALDKTGTHQPVPAAPVARPAAAATPATSAMPPVASRPATTSMHVAKAPSETASSAVARTLEARPAARGGSRIRARFSAGALHPMQPLDLYEGEIVEIEIAKTDKKIGG